MSTDNEETDVVDNELSQSLSFLVSPSRGNNFWARVINGCDKTFESGDIETVGTSISSTGRFVLVVNYPYFKSLSSRMKKFVLVAEAGHIVLRHHERVIRVLSQSNDPAIRLAVLSLWNIAIDIAVNDNIIRKEDDFAAAQKAGELDTFLFPETFDFPTGLTAEGYVQLLLKSRPEVIKKMEEMISQMGSGGQGQGQGTSIKGNGQGTISDYTDPNDAFIPEEINNSAQDGGDEFQKLLDAHKKLTGNSHSQWMKILEQMNADEALSMSNKLKKNATQLVGSAHEQTVRSRGLMPAYIQSMIKPLMDKEQIPWNWIFKDLVARAINAKIRPEMSSPNYSLLAEDSIEPWPGNTLDITFNILFMIDTSGSFGDNEFARAWKELEGLQSVLANLNITVVQGDAIIQNVSSFDKTEMPSSENISRYGRGGTVYTPMFKLMCGVDEEKDWNQPADRQNYTHVTPDLIIVNTDGGVVLEGECFPEYRPECPIIWLIAPGCSPAPGMTDNAPDHLIQMFEIKNYRQ